MKSYDIVLITVGYLLLCASVPSTQSTTELNTLTDPLKQLLEQNTKNNQCHPLASLVFKMIIKQWFNIM